MTYQEQLNGLDEIQIMLLKKHQLGVKDFLDSSKNRTLFLDTGSIIRSYQRWQKAVNEYNGFFKFCQDQKIDMNSEISLGQKHTINELCDWILGILYSQKNEGMTNLMQTFKSNSVEINQEELIMLKNMIQMKKFAVFQTSHSDFRASITREGIDFAEKSSFVDPETPIVIPD